MLHEFNGFSVILQIVTLQSCLKHDYIPIAGRRYSDLQHRCRLFVIGIFGMAPGTFTVFLVISNYRKLPKTSKIDKYTEVSISGVSGIIFQKGGGAKYDNLSL